MSVYGTHFEDRFDAQPKIATASPLEVAEDVATHRKTYRRFTRFFLWFALGAGAILAALIYFIYY